jgi:hypothetical protein
MELKIKQTEIIYPKWRKMDDFKGIKYSSSVKYLGVRMAIEKKDQTRITKEVINKNV